MVARLFVGFCLVFTLGQGVSPAVAVPATQAPERSPDALLHAALAEVRAVAVAGGWPRIGAGPLLRPGDLDPRVPALRGRLGLTPADRPDSLRFDDALVAAVRRFQTRHGLAPDGILGPRTVAALDVPAAARARQLAINLERRRWLPVEHERRRVLVNVPAGTLEMYAGDTLQGTMRAVVGRPDRPTPTLSSRITHLELNPAWNIPQKLARQDVLPNLRRDPAYLQQHGIRVFASWRDDAPELDPAAIDWNAIKPWDLAYRLRQEPGPLNPLGRLKFQFVNPYSVYIHDTPGRDRFTLPARFFSSGCVRIEDPVALARFLVEDAGGATRRRLEAALASDAPAVLMLPHAVPVDLVYWTAWVDPDGGVNFRDDVYGRDATLAAALLGPWSPVTDRSGVDVDEVGGWVVPDPAALLP